MKVRMVLVAGLVVAALSCNATSQSSSTKKASAERLIQLFRDLEVDRLDYKQVRSIFDQELPGWCVVGNSCTADLCRLEYEIEAKKFRQQKLVRVVALDLNVYIERDKVNYAVLGYSVDTELPRDGASVDVVRIPSSTRPAVEVVRTRGEGLNSRSAWIRMTSQATKEQILDATSFSLDCLEVVDQCSTVSDLLPTISGLLKSIPSERNEQH